jgi:hypothetical protein
MKVIGKIICEIAGKEVLAKLRRKLMKTRWTRRNEM